MLFLSTLSLLYYSSLFLYFFIFSILSLLLLYLFVFFLFLFLPLSYVLSFYFYSVISNSIVGPVSSPVTWKTGVRIPVGEFFWNFNFFFIIYTHSTCGLYFFMTYYCLGGVAHMVEHSLCMRGARGSIPRISIFLFFILILLYIFSITATFLFY